MVDIESEQEGRGKVKWEGGKRREGDRETSRVEERER